MPNLVVYNTDKKAIHVEKDIDQLTVKGKDAKWNGGEMRNIQSAFIVVNDNVNEGDDVTNLIPNDISATLQTEQDQLQAQLSQTQSVLNSMLLG